MTLTPADRPSMLSRRLKALVTPVDPQDGNHCVRCSGYASEVGGIAHSPDSYTGPRFESQP